VYFVYKAAKFHLMSGSQIKICKLKSHSFGVEAILVLTVLCPLSSRMAPQLRCSNYLRVQNGVAPRTVIPPTNTACRQYHGDNGIRLLYKAWVDHATHPSFYLFYYVMIWYMYTHPCIRHSSRRLSFPAH
jgi:hypothetical protein